MSWFDFAEERRSRNSKRRRLLRSDQNEPCKEDFIPASQNDVSEFDSDNEPHSSKKDKQDMVSRKSFNRCVIEMDLTRYSDKHSDASSIGSFESDSSSNEDKDCQALKNALPKIDHMKSEQRRNLAEPTLDEESDLISKKSKFQRVSSKTPNLNIDKEFCSSFSLKNTESTSQHDTKESAMSWLNGIKSPESKQIEYEDKSSKKILSKKLLPGGLAQRALSMSRFNKGEYLMWLHRIATSSIESSLNESCYFGTVKSHHFEHNHLCVSTISLDLSKREVTVLIPSDKKYGDPSNEILVVFPEFHCFIKNANRIIIALFHAQFFDQNEDKFVDIAKIDHFQDKEEISPPIRKPDSALKVFDSKIRLCSINTAQSHTLLNLHVCVCHLKVQGDYLQILGYDPEQNLVISEIQLQTAQSYWDQIALTFGMTCYLTELELCHVSLARKCLAWFPQIEMFLKGSEQKVYCLEQDAGSVKLDDGIDFDEQLVQSPERSELFCRYLGTVEIDGHYLTYVTSILGTVQWIEHQESFTFSYATSLKFIYLKSVNPMHYEFDSLSLVLVSLYSDKAMSITYPNLYTFEGDESELANAISSRLNLPLFNQHLPRYTACSISLDIMTVQYHNSCYYLSGNSCGALVNVNVRPSTMRRLLGMNYIAESCFDSIIGHPLRCTGIVINEKTVVEKKFDFFN